MLRTDSRKKGGDCLIKWKKAIEPTQEKKEKKDGKGEKKEEIV